MSYSILERARSFEEDIEQYENECADLMLEETKRVRAMEKPSDAPISLFSHFLTNTLAFDHSTETESFKTGVSKSIWRRSRRDMLV